MIFDDSDIAQKQQILNEEKSRSSALLDDVAQIGLHSTLANHDSSTASSVSGQLEPMSASAIEPVKRISITSTESSDSSRKRSSLVLNLTTEMVEEQILRHQNLLEQEEELRLSNIHLIPRHLKACLSALADNYVTVTHAEALDGVPGSNATNLVTETLLTKLNDAARSNTSISSDGTASSRSGPSPRLRSESDPIPISSSSSSSSPIRDLEAGQQDSILNYDIDNRSKRIIPPGESNSLSEKDIQSMTDEELVQQTRRLFPRVTPFLDLFDRVHPLPKNDDLIADTKPIDLLLNDFDADKLVMDRQSHLLFESRSIWFKAYENIVLNQNMEPMRCTMSIFEFHLTNKTVSRITESFHFPLTMGEEIVSSDCGERQLQTKALFFTPNVSRSEASNFYLLFKIHRRYVGEFTETIDKYFAKPEKIGKNARSIISKAKAWTARTDELYTPFAWAVVRLLDVINNPGDSITEDIYHIRGASYTDSDLLRYAIGPAHLREAEKIRTIPGTFTFRLQRITLPKILTYAKGSNNDLVLTLKDRSATRKRGGSETVTRTVRAREIHCCQQNSRHRRILHYHHDLFVYPLYIEFPNSAVSRFFSLHPVQIEAVFQTDDSSNPLPVFYDSYSGTMSTSISTNVIHANGKNSSLFFVDEIKCKLPFPLSIKHNLMFRFYHINIKKASRDLIAYSILNVFDGKRIRSDLMSIPVFLSSTTIDTGSQSIMLRLRAHPYSTAYPRNPHLNNFFHMIDAFDDEDDENAFPIEKHQREYNKKAEQVLKDLPRIPISYIAYAPMLLNQLFGMIQNSHEQQEEELERLARDAEPGTDADADADAKTEEEQPEPAQQQRRTSDEDSEGHDELDEYIESPVSGAATTTTIKKQHAFETLVELLDKYRCDDPEFLDHYIKNMFKFSSRITEPLLDQVNFHLNYSSETQIMTFMKNIRSFLAILVKAMILQKSEDPDRDFPVSFYEKMDVFISLELRILIEKHIERNPQEVIKLGQIIASMIRMLFRLMRREYVMVLSAKFVDTLWQTVNLKRSYSKSSLATLIDIELSFFKELFHYDQFFLLCLPSRVRTTIASDDSYENAKSSISITASKAESFIDDSNTGMGVVGNHFLFSQFADFAAKCVTNVRRTIRLKVISYLRATLSRQLKQQRLADGDLSEEDRRLNNRLNFELVIKLLDVFPMWKLNVDRKVKFLSSRLERLEIELTQVESQIYTMKQNIAKLRDSKKKQEKVQQQQERKKMRKKGSNNMAPPLPPPPPSELGIDDQRTKSGEDLSDLVQKRRRIREFISKDTAKLEKHSRRSKSEKRQFLACFIHIISHMEDNVLRDWWSTTDHTTDREKTNFVLALRECLKTFEYSGEMATLMEKRRMISEEDGFPSYLFNLDDMVDPGDLSRSDSSTSSTQSAGSPYNSVSTTSSANNTPSSDSRTIAPIGNVAAAAMAIEKMTQMAQDDDQGSVSKGRSTTIMGSLFGRSRKKPPTRPNVKNIDFTQIGSNTTMDEGGDTGSRTYRRNSSDEPRKRSKLDTSPRTIQYDTHLTPRAPPSKERDSEAMYNHLARLERSLCAEVSLFVLDKLIRITVDNKDHLATSIVPFTVHQTLDGERITVKEMTPLMISIVKSLCCMLKVYQPIILTTHLLEYVKYFLKEYHGSLMLSQTFQYHAPPPPPPPPPPQSPISNTSNVHHLSEKEEQEMRQKQLRQQQQQQHQQLAQQMAHSVQQKKTEHAKLSDQFCRTLMRLFDCQSSEYVRQQAGVALYLLVRYSFRLNHNIGKARVMTILALASTLHTLQEQYEKYNATSGKKGGSTGELVDMVFLRNTIDVIALAAKEDRQSFGNTVRDNIFINQVRQLRDRLKELVHNTITINRAIVKSSETDQHRIEDLFHSISDGYFHTPELRVVWLQQFANFHAEQKQFVEAAQCILVVLCIVFETLMIGNSPILKDIPITEHFFPINPYLVSRKRFIDKTFEMRERSQEARRDMLSSLMKASSGDLSSNNGGSSNTNVGSNIPEAHEFTEEGIIDMLNLCIMNMEQGEYFEHGISLLKVLLAFYERSQQYDKMSECYQQLMVMSDRIYQSTVSKSKARFFASYYRVRFFGNKYKTLHGKTFIYKMPRIFKLYQMVKIVKKMIRANVGEEIDPTVITSKTSHVDESTLDPEKVYVQITSVKPHFNDSASKGPSDHTTEFQKNTNLRQFFYEHAFQKLPDEEAGKSNEKSGMRNTYKIKTIVTIERDAYFPYVKTRVPVVEETEIEYTPIEVGIEVINSRNEILMESMQPPIDFTNLQMQLQGAVRANVNGGPREIVETFLHRHTRHLHDSRFVTILNQKCWQFLYLCSEALKLNANNATAPNQREFHNELEKGLFETKALFSQFLFRDKTFHDGIGGGISGSIELNLQGGGSSSLHSGNSNNDLTMFDDDSSSSDDDDNDNGLIKCK